MVLRGQTLQLQPQPLLSSTIFARAATVPGQDDDCQEMVGVDFEALAPDLGTMTAEVTMCRASSKDNESLPSLEPLSPLQAGSDTVPGVVKVEISLPSSYFPLVVFLAFVLSLFLLVIWCRQENTYAFPFNSAGRGRPSSWPSPLHGMDFDFPPSPHGMDLDFPPSPPSLLPSSKLLRFDSLPASNSGANRFLLGPSVWVFGLRAFQSALVWMAALPHLWFALLSMLICFACSILVFGLCGRPKKHPSSNLKAKALACILMLLVEKLFLLQAAAWRSLPSSAASSHPLTSSTEPFRPTHGLVPLLLDPLDESNNPLHNNIVHVESLLEREEEIVVLGSNGGISHVKNCAQVLPTAAWRSLPSSAASSHPLTSSTEPFRPTHGLVPLLLDPLDESNNPLHNNIVHVESLLEREEEIVVLGSNGGISHVKNCAQVLPTVPSNHGLAWEGWSFEPVPNTGAGDCFWLALAPEVGSPDHARNVVASWLLEHHDHPATTDADDIRKGALTSEWHVNATVQAYQHVFREGLCVFHAPTQSAILYTPGRFPATLPFSQYASSFRVEIPCLLYTHASTDVTGHFERLLVHGPRDHPIEMVDVDLPNMFGGMNATAPACSVSSLVEFGIPHHVACQSVIRFPGDLDAAVDWAMFEFEEVASAANASSPSSQVDELPAAPAEQACAGTILDAGSENHSSDRISQFSDAAILDRISQFSEATILDAPSEIHSPDRISQFSEAAILNAPSEIHSPDRISQVNAAISGAGSEIHSPDRISQFSGAAGVPPFVSHDRELAALYVMCLYAAEARMHSNSSSDPPSLSYELGLRSMEPSGSSEVFVDSSLDEIGAAQSTPPFSEAVGSFGNEPAWGNESMSSMHDMVAHNAMLQNLHPSQDYSPISATIPFTVQTPSQPFVPGCSCIGVYGVCFCGGAPGLLTQVQSSFDAETSIPHMHGGMFNATTPLSVVQQLQAMGVPAALANAAAARHPNCINSDLDWASDSERRHCGARVDSTALDVDLPGMVGGMNATPDRNNAPSQSLFHQLLDMGVPVPVARQAATRCPTDINAALDWACSSERRHSRPFHRLLETEGVIDLDPLDTAPSVVARVSQPPPSWGAWPIAVPPAAAPDHLAESEADVGSAVAPSEPFVAPLSLALVQVPQQVVSMAERASLYWQAAREDAHKFADALYQTELLAATGALMDTIPTRIIDSWLSLPATPPRHFSEFGLSFSDLFQEEVKLLGLRTTELHENKVAVSDACASQIDVVTLCPFPLAVAAILASAADIAPEFVIGFYYALAGWVCHHDLHALFDPIKKDRRTRPRCMVQCICDSAAGKSPFWRSFVSPWFTGVDAERSIFQTHPHCWATAGTKSLHFAQATDADLATRMMESGGRNFWASPECWLLLDTAHATRKAEASRDKINFHYLLECQNGNDYGPRSIKSSPVQIHVPTTNFGMLLLGQAECIHDFWGQVYTPGSPVRSKGFEGRPLFLFAGPARLCHRDQHISAEIIYAFLKAILLCIAETVGQNADAPFIHQPIKPENPTCWRDLQRAARQAEEDGPDCSQVAAAKWGYSCGTHIIAHHLFLSSFNSLPRSTEAMETLLSGGAGALALRPAPRDIPSHWFALSQDAFLSAPRFLSATMRSLSVIFAEMGLSLEERAGTKASTGPAKSCSRSRISSSEQILAKALQRQKHKGYLFMTDLKPHMPSKLRCEPHFQVLFELAQSLGVGVIEGKYPGTRAQPYRLKLTLENVGAAVRGQLGLEAEVVGGQAAPSLPHIYGGGKTRPAAKQVHRKPARSVRSEPMAAQPMAEQRPAAGSRDGPGRPCKDEPTLYTVKQTLHLESPFDGREDFLQQQKDWAAASEPGKRFSVRHQWYPSSTGFKVFLWCNSCACCKDRKGWRGYVTYTSDTKELLREFTPASFHGDFSAVKAWNPLTATTEHALKARLETEPRTPAQTLLKIAEKSQETAVPLKFMQTWRKNQKQLHAKERDDPEKVTKFAWTEADWRQLERTVGKINLEQPELEVKNLPNSLKIAASAYDPKATAMVLINPKLFHTVISMLANKDYVKLCGDGTHKLTYGDWTLMTLGVLSKHYASDGRTYCFCSTFTPLAFAIANSESRPCCSLLLQTVLHASTQLCQVDLSVAAKQFHADLAPGIEAARKSVLPNALRVSDYAHVIGACRPGKQKCKHQNVANHRSGLFPMVSHHLTVAGKPLLPLIENCVHCLRCVPTALIFHSIASLLFDTLLAQNPPEHAVVEKLQKTYFVKVPAAEARRQFQVVSWLGDPAFLWSASWWAGVQRTQPGSASGTQPQEAWHKHRLKAHIAVMRSSIPMFVENLNQFTKSTLQQLEQQGGTLPDIPPEPFPDRRCLYDSAILAASGRTSATQYHRCKAFTSHADASSQYFCMRRTEATYDPTQKTWSRTADNHVLKVLSSHVLVVLGTAARSYWRYGSEKAMPQPEAAAHQGAICMFCLEFCLHGTCEHTHVAFIETKQISLLEAELPQRNPRRAPPMSDIPALDLILPGPASVPEAGEMAQPMPVAGPSRLPQSAPAKASRELRAVLTRAACLEYLHLFLSEELSPSDLLNLDFPSIRAIFPNVPAAALLRVLRCAAEVPVPEAQRNEAEVPVPEAQTNEDAGDFFVEKELAAELGPREEDKNQEMTADKEDRSQEMTADKAIAASPPSKRHRGSEEGKSAQTGGRWLVAETIEHPHYKYGGLWKNRAAKVTTPSFGGAKVAKEEDAQESLQGA
eukprot:symbB.v1.2.024998.t1/scaffold2404.1/size80018/2